MAASGEVASDEPTLATILNLGQAAFVFTPMPATPCFRLDRSSAPAPRYSATRRPV
ncbi:hypothetical protein SBA4_4590040 [Candidatus Sulfopaludibacter sp. SbA4]|nr:hypothetical protein SBA4_4590040 [Candidatus Sulfopaludibacter sp. SbA4]